MTPPTVSVLMPVYNAERYVAEAVESVLNQTLADFEFLIIDDGSTDGTLGALQQSVGRDPRVRLTSRENRGIHATRNELLEAARGEFVAIMDADDVCLPGRLEKQLAYLGDNPSYAAVGCQVELIDPDSAVIGPWVMPTDHDAIDGANLLGNQSIVHPTLFARRAAVAAIGGYRCNLSEDLDLFLRLAEVGQLANLSATLLQYRRHSESTTHAGPAPLAAATTAVLSDAWLRRRLPGAPPLVSGRMPSRVADHRTWAWLALRAGKLSTARKHARVAVRLAPLSSASWKLLACALRGR